MLKRFYLDYKIIFGGKPFVLLKRYIYLTFYGLFKYLPTPIGDILRAVCLKFFLKKLGTIWVREGVTIHFPENVFIGESVVSEFVYMNGYGGIKIGDDVLIGTSSKFFSSDHIFEDISKPIWQQGLIKKPIVIGDDVYIGCNVTVLGGVTIGSGAVIGAGSIVTTDIPEYAIAVGIPAKIIGKRGTKIVEARHGMPLFS